jgi:hypothetical protein
MCLSCFLIHRILDIMGKICKKEWPADLLVPESVPNYQGRYHGEGELVYSNGSSYTGKLEYHLLLI